MFKRKQIDFESTAVQARVAGFQRALYLLLREFPNVCAKIQALFSENDADGDGVMSLNEFKELIAAMAEDAAGHEPPLLIQRYRAGKRTLDVADSFVFIDADGSDSIDFNEFLRFAGFDRHGNHMETPVLPFGRDPLAKKSTAASTAAAAAASAAIADNGAEEESAKTSDDVPDGAAAAALGAADDFADGAEAAAAADDVADQGADAQWDARLDGMDDAGVLADALAVLRRYVNPALRRWSGASQGVVGAEVDLLKSIFEGAGDHGREGQLSLRAFARAVRTLVPGGGRLLDRHVEALIKRFATPRHAPLFDAHAHLQTLARDSEGIDALVAAMRRSGVAHCCAVGTALDLTLGVGTRLSAHAATAAHAEAQHCSTSRMAQAGMTTDAATEEGEQHRASAAGAARPLSHARDFDARWTPADGTESGAAASAYIDVTRAEGRLDAASALRCSPSSDKWLLDALSTSLHSSSGNAAAAKAAAATTSELAQRLGDPLSIASLGIALCAFDPLERDESSAAAPSVPRTNAVEAREGRASSKAGMLKHDGGDGDALLRRRVPPAVESLRLSLRAAREMLAAASSAPRDLEPFSASSSPDTRSSAMAHAARTRRRTFVAVGEVVMKGQIDSIDPRLPQLRDLAEHMVTFVADGGGEKNGASGSENGASGARQKNGAAAKPQSAYAPSSPNGKQRRARQRAAARQSNHAGVSDATAASAAAAEHDLKHRGDGELCRAALDLCAEQSIPFIYRWAIASEQDLDIDARSAAFTPRAIETNTITSGASVNGDFTFRKGEAVWSRPLSSMSPYGCFAVGWKPTAPTNDSALSLDDRRAAMSSAEKRWRRGLVPGDLVDVRARSGIWNSAVVGEASALKGADALGIHVREGGARSNMMDPGEESDDEGDLLLPIVLTERLLSGVGARNGAIATLTRWTTTYSIVLEREKSKSNSKGSKKKTKKKKKKNAAAVLKESTKSGGEEEEEEADGKEDDVEDDSASWKFAWRGLLGRYVAVASAANASTLEMWNAAPVFRLEAPLHAAQETTERSRRAAASPPLPARRSSSKVSQSASRPRADAETEADVATEAVVDSAGVVVLPHPWEKHRNLTHLALFRCASGAWAVGVHEPLRRQGCAALSQSNAFDPRDLFRVERLDRRRLLFITTSSDGGRRSPVGLRWSTLGAVREPRSGQRIKTFNALSAECGFKLRCVSNTDVESTMWLAKDDARIAPPFTKTKVWRGARLRQRNANGTFRLVHAVRNGEAPLGEGAMSASSASTEEDGVPAVQPLRVRLMRAPLAAAAGAAAVNAAGAPTTLMSAPLTTPATASSTILTDTGGGEDTELLAVDADDIAADTVAGAGQDGDPATAATAAAASSNPNEASSPTDAAAKSNEERENDAAASKVNEVEPEGNNASVATHATLKSTMKENKKAETKKFFTMEDLHLSHARELTLYPSLAIGDRVESLERRGAREAAEEAAARDLKQRRKAAQKAMKEKAKQEEKEVLDAKKAEEKATKKKKKAKEKRRKEKEKAAKKAKKKKKKKKGKEKESDSEVEDDEDEPDIEEEERIAAAAAEAEKLRTARELSRIASKVEAIADEDDITALIKLAPPSASRASGGGGGTNGDSEEDSEGDVGFASRRTSLSTADPYTTGPAPKSAWSGVVVALNLDASGVEIATIQLDEKKTKEETGGDDSAPPSSSKKQAKAKKTKKKKAKKTLFTPTFRCCFRSELRVREPDALKPFEAGDAVVVRKSGATPWEASVDAVVVARVMAAIDEDDDDVEDSHISDSPTIASRSRGGGGGGGGGSVNGPTWTYDVAILGKGADDDSDDDDDDGSDDENAGEEEDDDVREEDSVSSDSSSVGSGLPPLASSSVPLSIVIPPPSGIGHNSAVRRNLCTVVVAKAPRIVPRRVVSAMESMLRLHRGTRFLWSNAGIAESGSGDGCTLLSIEGRYVKRVLLPLLSEHPNLWISYSPAVLRAIRSAGKSSAATCDELIALAHAFPHRVVIGTSVCGHFSLGRYAADVAMLRSDLLGDRNGGEGGSVAGVDDAELQQNALHGQRSSSCAKVMSWRTLLATSMSLFAPPTPLRQRGESERAAGAPRFRVRERVMALRVRGAGLNEALSAEARALSAAKTTVDVGGVSRRWVRSKGLSAAAPRDTKGAGGRRHHLDDSAGLLLTPSASLSQWEQATIVAAYPDSQTYDVRFWGIPGTTRRERDRLNVVDNDDENVGEDGDSLASRIGSIVEFNVPFQLIRVLGDERRTAAEAAAASLGNTSALQPAAAALAPYTQWGVALADCTVDVDAFILATCSGSHRGIPSTALGRVVGKIRRSIRLRIATRAAEEVSEEWIYQDRGGHVHGPVSGALLVRWMRSSEVPSTLLVAPADTIPGRTVDAWRPLNDAPIAPKLGDAMARARRALRLRFMHSQWLSAVSLADEAAAAAERAGDTALLESHFASQDDAAAGADGEGGGDGVEGGAGNDEGAQKEKTKKARKKKKEKTKKSPKPAKSAKSPKQLSKKKKKKKKGGKKEKGDDDEGGDDAPDATAALHVDASIGMLTMCAVCSEGPRSLATDNSLRSFFKHTIALHLDDDELSTIVHDYCNVFCWYRCCVSSCGKKFTTEKKLRAHIFKQHTNGTSAAADQKEIKDCGPVLYRPTMLSQPFDTSIVMDFMQTHALDLVSASAARGAVVSRVAVHEWSTATERLMRAADWQLVPLDLAATAGGALRLAARDKAHQAQRDAQIFRDAVEDAASEVTARGKEGRAARKEAKAAAKAAKAAQKSVLAQTRPSLMRPLFLWTKSAHTAELTNCTQSRGGAVSDIALLHDLESSAGRGAASGVSRFVLMHREHFTSVRGVTPAESARGAGASGAVADRGFERSRCIIEGVSYLVRLQGRQLHLFPELSERQRMDAAFELRHPALTKSAASASKLSTRGDAGTKENDGDDEKKEGDDEEEEAVVSAHLSSASLLWRLDRIESLTLSPAPPSAAAAAKAQAELAKKNKGMSREQGEAARIELGFAAKDTSITRVKIELQLTRSEEALLPKRGVVRVNAQKKTNKKKKKKTAAGGEDELKTDGDTAAVTSSSKTKKKKRGFLRKRIDADALSTVTVVLEFTGDRSDHDAAAQLAATIYAQTHFLSSKMRKTDEVKGWHAGSSPLAEAIAPHGVASDGRSADAVRSLQQLLGIELLVKRGGNGGAARDLCVSIADPLGVRDEHEAFTVAPPPPSAQHVAVRSVYLPGVALWMRRAPPVRTALAQPPAAARIEGGVVASGTAIDVRNYSSTVRVGGGPRAIGVASVKLGLAVAQLRKDICAYVADSSTAVATVGDALPLFAPGSNTAPTLLEFANSIRSSFGVDPCLTVPTATARGLSESLRGRTPREREAIRRALLENDEAERRRDEAEKEARHARRDARNQRESATRCPRRGSDFDSEDSDEEDAYRRYIGVALLFAPTIKIAVPRWKLYRPDSAEIGAASRRPTVAATKSGHRTGNGIRVVRNGATKASTKQSVSSKENHGRESRRRRRRNRRRRYHSQDGSETATSSSYDDSFSSRSSFYSEDDESADAQDYYRRSRRHGGGNESYSSDDSQDDVGSESGASELAEDELDDTDFAHVALARLERALTAQKIMKKDSQTMAKKKKKKKKRSRRRSKRKSKSRSPQRRGHNRRGTDDYDYDSASSEEDIDNASSPAPSLLTAVDADGTRWVHTVGDDISVLCESPALVDPATLERARREAGSMAADDLRAALGKMGVTRCGRQTLPTKEALIDLYLRARQLHSLPHCVEVRTGALLLSDRSSQPKTHRRIIRAAARAAHAVLAVAKHCDASEGARRYSVVCRFAWRGDDDYLRTIRAVEAVRLDGEVESGESSSYDSADEGSDDSVGVQKKKRWLARVTKDWAGHGKHRAALSKSIAEHTHSKYGKGKHRAALKRWLHHGSAHFGGVQRPDFAGAGHAATAGAGGDVDAQIATLLLSLKTMSEAEAKAKLAELLQNAHDLADERDALGSEMATVVKAKRGSRKNRRAMATPRYYAEVVQRKAFAFRRIDSERVSLLEVDERVVVRSGIDGGADGAARGGSSRGSQKKTMKQTTVRVAFAPRSALQETNSIVVDVRPNRAAGVSSTAGVQHSRAARIAAASERGALGALHVDVANGQTRIDMLAVDEKILSLVAERIADALGESQEAAMVRSDASMLAVDLRSSTRYRLVHTERVRGIRFDRNRSLHRNRGTFSVSGSGAASWHFCGVEVLELGLDVLGARPLSRYPAIGYAPLRTAHYGVDASGVVAHRGGGCANYATSNLYNAAATDLADSPQRQKTLEGRIALFTLSAAEMAAILRAVVDRDADLYAAPQDDGATRVDRAAFAHFIASDTTPLIDDRYTDDAAMVAATRSADEFGHALPGESSLVPALAKATPPRMVATAMTTIRLANGMAVTTPAAAHGGGGADERGEGGEEAAVLELSSLAHTDRLSAHSHIVALQQHASSIVHRSDAEIAAALRIAAGAMVDVRRGNVWVRGVVLRTHHGSVRDTAALGAAHDDAAGRSAGETAPTLAATTATFGADVRLEDSGFQRPHRTIATNVPLAMMRPVRPPLVKNARVRGKTRGGRHTRAGASSHAMSPDAVAAKSQLAGFKPSLHGGDDPDPLARAVGLEALCQRGSIRDTRPRDDAPWRAGVLVVRVLEASGGAFVGMDGGGDPNAKSWENPVAVVQLRHRGNSCGGAFVATAPASHVAAGGTDAIRRARLQSELQATRGGSGADVELGGGRAARFDASGRPISALAGSRAEIKTRVAQTSTQAREQVRCGHGARRRREFRRRGVHGETVVDMRDRATAWWSQDAAAPLRLRVWPPPSRADVKHTLHHGRGRAVEDEEDLSTALSAAFDALAPVLTLTLQQNETSDLGEGGVAEVGCARLHLASLLRSPGLVRRVKVPLHVPGSSSSGGGGGADTSSEDGDAGEDGEGTTTASRRRYGGHHSKLMGGTGKEGAAAHVHQGVVGEGEILLEITFVQALDAVSTGALDTHPVLRCAAHDDVGGSLFVAVDGVDGLSPHFHPSVRHVAAQATNNAAAVASANDGLISVVSPTKGELRRIKHKMEALEARAADELKHTSLHLRLSLPWTRVQMSALTPALEPNPPMGRPSSVLPKQMQQQLHATRHGMKPKKSSHASGALLSGARRRGDGAHRGFAHEVRLVVVDAEALPLRAFHGSIHHRLNRAPDACVRVLRLSRADAAAADLVRAPYARAQNEFRGRSARSVARSLHAESVGCTATHPPSTAPSWHHDWYIGVDADDVLVLLLCDAVHDNVIAVSSLALRDALPTIVSLVENDDVDNAEEDDDDDDMMVCGPNGELCLALFPWTQPAAVPLYAPPLGSNAAHAADRARFALGSDGKPTAILRFSRSVAGRAGSWSARDARDDAARAATAARRGVHNEYHHSLLVADDVDADAFAQAAGDLAEEAEAEAAAATKEEGDGGKQKKGQKGKKKEKEKKPPKAKKLKKEKKGKKNKNEKKSKRDAEDDDFGKKNKNTIAIDRGIVHFGQLHIRLELVRAPTWIVPLKIASSSAAREVSLDFSRGEASGGAADAAFGIGVPSAESKSNGGDALHAALASSIDGGALTAVVELVARCTAFHDPHAPSGFRMAERVVMRGAFHFSPLASYGVGGARVGSGANVAPISAVTGLSTQKMKEAARNGRRGGSCADASTARSTGDSLKQGAVFPAVLSAKEERKEAIALRHRDSARHAHVALSFVEGAEGSAHSALLRDVFEAHGDDGGVAAQCAGDALSEGITVSVDLRFEPLLRRGDGVRCGASVADAVDASLGVLSFEDEWTNHLRRIQGSGAGVAADLVGRSVPFVSTRALLRDALAWAATGTSTRSSGRSATTSGSGDSANEGGVRLRISVLRGADFVPSLGDLPRRATWVKLVESRHARARRSRSSAAHAMTMRTAVSGSTLNPTWNEFIGTVSVTSDADVVALRVYYDDSQRRRADNSAHDAMATATLRIGSIVSALRRGSDFGAVQAGARKIVTLPLALSSPLARAHGLTTRGEIVVAIVVAEASRASFLDIAAERIVSGRLESEAGAAANAGRGQTSRVGAVELGPSHELHVIPHDQWRVPTPSERAEVIRARRAATAAALQQRAQERADATAKARRVRSSGSSVQDAARHSAELRGRARSLLAPKSPTMRAFSSSDDDEAAVSTMLAAERGSHSRISRLTKGKFGDGNTQAKLNKLTGGEIGGGKHRRQIASATGGRYGEGRHRKAFKDGLKKLTGKKGGSARALHREEQAAAALREEERRRGVGALGANAAASKVAQRIRVEKARTRQRASAESPSFDAISAQQKRDAVAWDREEDDFRSGAHSSRHGGERKKRGFVSRATLGRYGEGAHRHKVDKLLYGEVDARTLDAMKGRTYDAEYDDSQFRSGYHVHEHGSGVNLAHSTGGRFGKGEHRRRVGEIARHVGERLSRTDGIGHRVESNRDKAERAMTAQGGQSNAASPRLHVGRGAASPSALRHRHRSVSFEDSPKRFTTSYVESYANDVAFGALTASPPRRSRTQGGFGGARSKKRPPPVKRVDTGSYTSAHIAASQGVSSIDRASLYEEVAGGSQKRRPRAKPRNALESMAEVLARYDREGSEGMSSQMSVSNAPEDTATICGTRELLDAFSRIDVRGMGFISRSDFVRIAKALPTRFGGFDEEMPLAEGEAHTPLFGRATFADASALALRFRARASDVARAVQTMGSLRGKHVSGSSRFRASHGVAFNKDQDIIAAQNAVRESIDFGTRRPQGLVYDVNGSLVAIAGGGGGGGEGGGTEGGSSAGGRRTVREGGAAHRRDVHERSLRALGADAVDYQQFLYALRTFKISH